MTSQQSVENDEEISLASIFSVPLRHLRLVILVPIVLVALTLAVVFLEPRYIARSTFVPEQTTTQGALGGLAAQFGISVASTSGESPAFYTKLLLTTALLQQVADTLYDTGDGKSRTLPDLLQIDKEDSPASRLRQSAKYLRDNTEPLIDAASGMVTINVTTPWPRVSEQINRRMLNLLNDFNVTKRQTRVSAERIFVETRLKEVQRDLAAAEAALQAFLRNNRMFESSSELRFEAARLQRNVDLQQQVYGTLAPAYEQARIEQVRTTALLTVVDPPEGSAGNAYPWKLLVVISTLVGIVLALLLAFAIELVRHQRVKHPQEFAALSELRANALRRLFSGRSTPGRS
jgi:uncharacterized protein involved in exopolysaccharide biosynthesis